MGERGGGRAGLLLASRPRRSPPPCLLPCRLADPPRGHQELALHRAGRGEPAEAVGGESRRAAGAQVAPPCCGHMISPTPPPTAGGPLLAHRPHHPVRHHRGAGARRGGQHPHRGARRRRPRRRAPPARRRLALRVQDAQDARCVVGVGVGRCWLDGWVHRCGAWVWGLWRWLRACRRALDRAQVAARVVRILAFLPPPSPPAQAPCTATATRTCSASMGVRAAPKAPPGASSCRWGDASSRICPRFGSIGDLNHLNTAAAASDDPDAVPSTAAAVLLSACLPCSCGTTCARCCACARSAPRMCPTRCARCGVCGCAGGADGGRVQS